MNFQQRHFRGQIGLANAAVHHAVAGFADCAKIAGNGRRGEIVEHPQCGRSRFAASETIDHSRRARPLAAGVALGKVCPHSSTLKKHRAAGVDRLQPTTLPKPDGVLVNAKTARQLWHAVAPVQLDPLLIGAARGQLP